jgi:hypothetical protein
MLRHIEWYIVRGISNAHVSIFRVRISHCIGDKIEKNEMGGACSADEGERRVKALGGEM